jgi:hypothetical protein
VDLELVELAGRQVLPRDAGAAPDPDVLFDGKTAAYAEVIDELIGFPTPAFGPVAKPSSDIDMSK